MQHLLAYYASQDPAGAYKQVAPVPDQAVRSTTTGFTVPSDVANLVVEAAMSASTGPVAGQVQSPSLRQSANQDVFPIVAAVKFGANPAIQEHFSSPRSLKGNEEMEFYTKATGGAAAVQYGLAVLSDGPVQPVKGNIFTVLATGDAILSAGAWVNTALTFNSTLPAGTYAVVGFRAQGANLVAARLSFVGAGYRPGVPAVNAVGDQDSLSFRYGNCGQLGVFDVNQPPTVDCLGVTDASQNFALDLIKVS